MKKPLVISILLAIAPLSFAATHNLDGRTLTVDELWAISAPGEIGRASCRERVFEGV